MYEYKYLLNILKIQTVNQRETEGCSLIFNRFPTTQIIRNNEIHHKIHPGIFWHAAELKFNGLTCYLG